MARRTKEDALATREALLDAAVCVFGRRGVARSSLAEIAEQAGLTRGAVYWHFKDKGELFNAMMDRVTLPLEADLIGHCEGQGDPVVELRDKMRRAMRTIEHDALTQNVLEIATLKVEHVDDMGPVRDRYVAAHRGQIQARLLPLALEVLAGHRARGDRVVVATGAPPELARSILDFAGHGDVPVIGTAVGPRLGAMVATRHCHHEEKMRMLRERGYGDIEVAYSDSSADLPLLRAARRPVVVNPKPGRVEAFRRVLPAGTPILNWGCKDRAGDPV